MKNSFFAIAFTVLGLPLMAHAGTKIAATSMEVSFVVRESCNVQSAAAGKAAQRPNVACQLNTPYQINSQAAPMRADKAGSSDSATAIRNDSGAQDWTITF